MVYIKCEQHFWDDSQANLTLCGVRDGAEELTTEESLFKETAALQADWTGQRPVAAAVLRWLVARDRGGAGGGGGGGAIGRGSSYSGQCCWLVLAEAAVAGGALSWERCATVARDGG